MIWRLPSLLLWPYSFFFPHILNKTENDLEIESGSGRREDRTDRNKLNQAQCKQSRRTPPPGGEGRGGNSRGDRCAQQSAIWGSDGGHPDPGRPHSRGQRHAPRPGGRWERRPGPREALTWPRGPSASAAPVGGARAGQGAPGGRRSWLPVPGPRGRTREGRDAREPRAAWHRPEAPSRPCDAAAPAWLQRARCLSSPERHPLVLGPGVTACGSGRLCCWRPSQSPSRSSPDLGACDFIILPTRAAEVSERAALVGGGLCFHTWVILALRSLGPQPRGLEGPGYRKWVPRTQL